jgi:hypothetical protein
MLPVTNSEQAAAHKVNISRLPVRQDLDIGEQIQAFLKPHAPRSCDRLVGLLGTRTKNEWIIPRAGLEATAQQ